MANPVLVLKLLRLAREMRVNRLPQRIQIFGMDTTKPVPWTTHAALGRQTDHRSPSR